MLLFQSVQDFFFFFDLFQNRFGVFAKSIHFVLIFQACRNEFGGFGGKQIWVHAIKIEI